jgi:hypothetical protein
LLKRQQRCGQAHARHTGMQKYLSYDEPGQFSPH